MTDYGFLANLTLVDKGRRLTPKEKNPEGLTVRLFSTGEVYPGKELVEQFKLEYQAKGNNGGIGFDVIDSKKWSVIPAELPRMILFSTAPKEEAKVDLFASWRYNGGGQPKSSVMTQGNPSKELLALVKEMGWLTEEQKYVDLVVLTQHPVKTENGVAYIPKTVDRGARKGEDSYVRRENVVMYPVEPVDLAAIQVKTPYEQAAEQNELVTEAETI